MNYLIIFLLTLTASNSWGNCPQFETALEKAMAIVALKEESKAAAGKSSKSGWAAPEAQSYKSQYSQSTSAEADNRGFITFMDSDKGPKGANVLYFNVENSVQKKLNDSIIGDKGMVDAINNSFYIKFNKNLSEHPELMARLQGRYAGYKSEDLRIALKPGESPAALEKELAEIYKKTNAEFVEEFERLGLTKLIPPRTDEVVDVSTWFLSGTGKSPLEANMSSRSARTAGFSPGKARTLNFSERIELMHEDVLAIEGLRKKLASMPELLESGIMIKLPSGEIVPSKKTVEILRQTKLSDCENLADYIAKFKAKVKTQFNSDISESHIDDLSSYFQKTDSFSPPIFERERVHINLGEADKGLVSVDFTGVGVDNAFEQMRALSAVNYAQKEKSLLLKDAFDKIQRNVDNVTTEINEAKRFFAQASKSKKDASAPKFSGDDGMLMPKIDWSAEEKIALIKKLSKFKDPSKFRVTFVKTKFTNGSQVPVGDRSIRVVRAESIEKDLRKDLVGALKIPQERSKEMIFAIDYVPNAKGGQFNLFIGGQKPTAQEKKMIIESFTKAIQKKDGEAVGEIIEVIN